MDAHDDLAPTARTSTQRLYRATAAAQWVLDPSAIGDTRTPVTLSR